MHNQLWSTQIAISADCLGPSLILGHNSKLHWIFWKQLLIWFLSFSQLFTATNSEFTSPLFHKATTTLLHWDCQLVSNQEDVGDDYLTFKQLVFCRLSTMHLWCQAPWATAEVLGVTSLLPPHTNLCTNCTMGYVQRFLPWVFKSVSTSLEYCNSVERTYANTCLC